MPEQAFLSPAKLNLFLHITGKRPDGYHNLQTLFQFLDWCDTLYFTNFDTPGEIELSNAITGVPNEQNLIYKAADALRKASGCDKGTNIRIDKVLPMGGGLGGGSSNAATTLVALNHLWETGLSLQELADIGNTLGADVPVFVMGRTAIAEGTGEILNPIEIEEPYYLILKPDCHVETAALFRDKHLTRNTIPITLRAVLEGPIDEIGHNDFEPVARRLFPEIEAGFNLLNRFGSAKLTGTGACIFCRFPNKETATEALQTIDSEPKAFAFSTYLAKGLNISPLFGEATALSC